ncbi:MAG TPA: hemerythrin domain-containing protein [Polyangiaceae bacterium]
MQRTTIVSVAQALPDLAEVGPNDVLAFRWQVSDIKTETPKRWGGDHQVRLRLPCVQSNNDGAPLRRHFLRQLAAVGLTAVGCTRHAPGEQRDEAEVTPGEDLMQEHGLIERLLLIYDEAAHRIESNVPVDSSVILRSAGIMRRFVEEYHEQLEEQHIFPRLQRAQRELALVGVLLAQHRRGRELTEEITRRAAAPDAASNVAPRGASTRLSMELARVLRAFVRMYRPHAAHEDTVLFPAFRTIVGKHGYLDLGEEFERREHQLFGEHGFESTVAEVARLETEFGIADLASFTPT